MKELQLREFKKELKIMAVSCIGKKEDIARKKASKILKKYDEIFSDNKSGKELFEKEYRRINKEYRKIKDMFDVLKSGKISYSRGETRGVLLIKDIEQVEVRKTKKSFSDDEDESMTNTDVLVITKTGREIIMGSGFQFLRELF